MSPLRWLLLCAALVTGVAHAQRVHTAGDYEVHYTAFPSAFLTPEVAREYGVLRSRARGVLVVAVRRDGSPVNARVEARVGPGGGRLQPLELRHVKTDGTASYIGSFAIADGESRQFQLTVTPGDAAPFAVSFSQQFFDAQ